MLPSRMNSLAAGLVLAILMVGASAIGVAALRSSSDGSRPDSARFPEELTNSEPLLFGSLLAPNRDRLRVCIQPVDLSRFEANEAVARVYQALAVAAGNRDGASGTLAAEGAQ